MSNKSRHFFRLARRRHQLYSRELYILYIYLAYVVIFVIELNDCVNSWPQIAVSFQKAALSCESFATNDGTEFNRIKRNFCGKHSIFLIPIRFWFWWTRLTSNIYQSFNHQERHEPGSLSSPLKSPSKIPGLSRPASATPSQKSQDRARAASRTRTLKTPDSPLEPVKKSEWIIWNFWSANKL